MSPITMTVAQTPYGWTFSCIWIVAGQTYSSCSLNFQVPATGPVLVEAIFKAGTQGSLSFYDLNYAGTPPASDGSDEHTITVELNAPVTVFFAYAEGNAGNDYIIRVYTEWDKGTAIAKSDEHGTIGEVGRESGSSRWGIGWSQAPSVPGTYRIRFVYSASSTPPTWDHYDRLLAEGSVTVLTPPTQFAASASAIPTSGLAPLTVQFSGSASGGTPPYSYNWNFGDGVTSQTQNPAHYYANQGTYTVTLTVTDQVKNNAQATVTITVETQPARLTASASANPTTGSPPLTVQFSGSAAGGTPPYSYNWDFGDGVSSQTQNPAHYYANPGTYVATLSVTDQTREKAQSTVTITVNAAPAFKVVLMPP
jgi:PKD repeat protein